MERVAGERVLVVDDESKIADIVKLYLEREGYKVAVCGDGKVALEMFSREAPDLIVLDLMLPGLDGLEVCKRIRQESKVPVVMLTARDDEVDKILGLELGADDYLTKPFSPRELVARVRAVLRRANAPATQEDTTIRLGDLVIDLRRHEARYRDQVLDLTPMEFRLLSVMARSTGRVFTRLQLLDLTQGEAYEGYERTVDAHIKNLRHKLGEKLAPSLVTVRGVGYKFEEPQGA